jgi:hypothetical protein
MMKRFFAAAALFLVMVNQSAHANESIFCKGKKYSIEVQVSISTGDITGALFYDHALDDTMRVHLVLGKRSIDYKKKKIALSAITPDDSDAKPVKLNVLNKRGSVRYINTKKHALTCDWAAFSG